jgi:hypothetical protein
VLVFLLACTKSTPPASSAAKVELPDLRDEMEDHFYRALQLQLAVIGGDLPAAQAAAGTLATDLATGTFPEAWKPFVDEAAKIATRAAAATSISEAATALGDLSATCADCHTATGGGLEGATRDPVPHEHMARHLYGAYWMGYGLIAPDERAWHDGARALGSAPIGADAPALRHVDARLHDLAARGAPMTDPHERAALWGELLVVCAECHSTLEGPR